MRLRQKNRKTKQNKKQASKQANKQTNEQTESGGVRCYLFFAGVFGLREGARKQPKRRGCKMDPDVHTVTHNLPEGTRCGRSGKHQRAGDDFEDPPPLNTKAMAQVGWRPITSIKRLDLRIRLKVLLK